MSPRSVFTYSGLLLIWHHHLLSSLVIASLDSKHQTGVRIEFVKNLNFTEVQQINGATIYQETLLLYSNHLLHVFDIGNLGESENGDDFQTSTTKYIMDFRAIKLVAGSQSQELLYITKHDHCVKILNFQTRQTSVLTGACQTWGNSDGDRLSARFHSLRDITNHEHRYYVADFENHSVRRVSSEGLVTTILEMHSRPYAISGNLFIASLQKVFLMLDNFNTYTYTPFLSNIDVLDMKSCSLDHLYVLNNNRGISIIRISNGNPEPLHRTDIDLTTASYILCYRSVSLFLTFERSNSSNTVHLKMYRFETERGEMTLSSRASSIASTPPVNSSFHPNGSGTDANSDRSSNAVSTNPSIDMEKLHHPDQTPEMLGNHAHSKMDHLSRTTSELGRSPPIIAAATVSLSFVILVALGFFFVISRRKRSFEELAAQAKFQEDCDVGDLDENLFEDLEKFIDSNIFPPPPTFGLIESGSYTNCQHVMGISTDIPGQNGYYKESTADRASPHEGRELLRS